MNRSVDIIRKWVLVLEVESVCSAVTSFELFHILDWKIITEWCEMNFLSNLVVVRFVVIDLDVSSNLLKILETERVKLSLKNCSVDISSVLDNADTSSILDSINIELFEQENLVIELSRAKFINFNFGQFQLGFDRNLHL